MSLYDLAKIRNLNMSDKHKELLYGILLNAQEEEAMASNTCYSFRMVLGISSYELPEPILEYLQNAGYRFVIGKNYSYLEWNKKDS